LVAGCTIDWIAQRNCDCRRWSASRELGRTTGLTFGVIEEVEVDARILVDADHEPLWFKGLIIVENAAGQAAFSRAGDSGAPVFSKDTRRLLGFVFAGAEQRTYVMPIQPVLQALGVSLLISKAR
jgi:hypothetical protein